MKPHERNRAIFASRLDALAKLVCVAIADHMSQHDQDVYPSVARLSEMTSIAERTVRDVLRAGRSDGWLITTDRPGSTSLLRIDWEALANTDAKRTAGARKVGTGRRGTTAAGAGVDPCTGRTPPLHGAHAPPAAGAPHPCAPPLRGSTHDFREERADNRTQSQMGPLRPLPTKEHPIEHASEHAIEPQRRARPENAPVVKGPSIPEPDTFADPADVVLDSGNEVPGRLSDLLAEMHEMSPQRVIARLLMVPVESTRALLELSRGQWYGAEGRCYVTGCASLRGPLDRYLQARWGVGLGALATTHEAPRHTRTGPSFASVLDELGEGPPRRNAIDAEVLR